MTSSKETRTHWCVNCWCACVCVCLCVNNLEHCTGQKKTDEDWNLELDCSAPFQQAHGNHAKTHKHTRTHTYTLLYTVHDTQIHTVTFSFLGQKKREVLGNSLGLCIHTHTHKPTHMQNLNICCIVALYACMLVSVFIDLTYYIDFSVSLHHVCYKSYVMCHTSSTLYGVYLQPISNTDIIIGCIISGQNCVNKI